MLGKRNDQLSFAALLSIMLLFQYVSSSPKETIPRISVDSFGNQLASEFAVQQLVKHCIMVITLPRIESSFRIVLMFLKVTVP